MSSDCNILNPLQRDGLSQDKRLVHALHPSFVKVDERDISDLLLYAREYAKLIQFYSLENNTAGDWRKFIESDVSTLVAIIAKFDASALKEQYDNEADVEKKLALILELIQIVYKWFANSIPDLKLHAALERVINSILTNSITTTLAYAKRIEEVSGPVTVSNLEFEFSGIDIDAVQTDTSLFPSNGYSDDDEISLALSKITRVFQTTYESVLSIIFQAPDFLTETLEEYHQHQPHMALFLAFLKLFKIAQEHLNTITKRHLDFYYQEVLQLGLREEQPDEVHLVFELAKNFDQYKIDQDTLFRAGKDGNDTNIFFGLDNELVLNKTKLYEDGLKTIFIDKKYANSTDPITQDTPYSIANIYAAPKANTVDGIKEELEAEDKWLTFGDDSRPYGEVGFVISAPILLLHEGTRVVDFTFNFNIVDPETGLENVDYNDPNLAKELKRNIKIQYTGAEEWIDAPLTAVQLFADLSDPLVPTLAMNLRIILSNDFPACTFFDSEIHTPALNTTKPSFKFIMDNEGLSVQSFSDGISAVVSGSTGMTMASARAVATPEVTYDTTDAPLYNEEENYDIGDVVRYEGKWFIARANGILGITPTIGSGVWYWVEQSYPYQYFLPLELNDVNIVTKVTGVKSLILESDVGTINPAKPFLPFGPLPKKGSKFFIGSPEVFQKQLKGNTGGTVNALDIVLDWGDLPEVNFPKLYENYTPADLVPEDDDEFKVKLAYLKDQNWITPSTTYSLFKSNIVTTTPPEANSLAIPSFLNTGASKMISFENYTTDLRNGFIRLELQQNFLHKAYPSSLTTYIAGSGSTDAPREPYTPIVNSITLNYRSESNLVFKNTPYDDASEQLFHITPFGWQEFYSNNNELPEEGVIFSKKLVPEFTLSDTEDPREVIITDAEGTLFIGLTDLAPEQNVSLLFQMAEGSADPDLPSEEITWSYLSNNVWQDFDRTQLLSDTTNELLTSGIVTLVMPKEMTKENTLLPTDVYWIKVSAARLVNAISKTIAIYPQAAKASFRKETGNDLSRLSTPMPAETIKKLKERQASVKTILQPFSSFNGKLIEQNETPEGVTGEELFNKDYNEFYIRISERLKHKNRAVTIDDYERLVLQEFPDVYKVKCLNHTGLKALASDGSISESEHAPGMVKLIVVPNLRNRNAVNPLQPKVSSNRLSEIQSFVDRLNSDFVTLEVQNPIFEEISVDFKVRFHPGFDKGFYTAKLQEDIVRFLTPWLYDDGAELSLGGKVHRSVILNFVEETEYVDYVTDFKLNHFIPGIGLHLDVEEAVVKTSSSVIVSRPATKHIIDPDTLDAC